EDGLWRVSTEDVKRKDDIEIKPEEGIWTVGVLAGYFQALISPDCTLLPEISTPKRIWICLDYEEGWVAFFGVDEGIFIC
ncbi:TRI10 protein, partial [Daphoenositta chrysoptera]|nr:TRI10 protein [Daphoenositta chrysoptera]